MAREQLYDLIIVGGGPAGLSAAIGAESEGVDSLVLEADPTLGGQAGESSLIENYAGFPNGISGVELTGNMVRQALRFNTELVERMRADRIERADDGFAVADGEKAVYGRAVLVSAGVEYRELDVPSLPNYLERGAKYGSPCVKEDFSGKKVYVVGGANSAGQAAMHLSQFDGCEVNLVVRGRNLEDKMSSYLTERIAAAPNIDVHTETQVVDVDGDGKLEEVVLACNGDERRVAAHGLFVMIGAIPKTNWLPEAVERDRHGFIRTGNDVSAEVFQAFVEDNGRLPLFHETSMAGVFAAGDVRSGTVKRVASAVGDGATAIPDIHKYLATLR